MARKAKFTASLPKLGVPQQLRDRIERIVEATDGEVTIADVQRDALIAIVPMIELQLGLVEPEVDEEEPAAPMAGTGWGPG